MSDSPQSIYGTFFGHLTKESAAQTVRILGDLAGPNGLPIGSEVHMQFQCFGGEFHQAIALHDYLASYPLNLTLYGSVVKSAGAVAFLGARNRKAAPHAAFLVHGILTRVTGDADIQELRTFLKAASLDNDRLKAILGQYLNLPDGDWADYKSREIAMNARQAADLGFLTGDSDEERFARFAPPPNSRLIQFWCDRDVDGL